MGINAAVNEEAAAQKAANKNANAEAEAISSLSAEEFDRRIKEIANLKSIPQKINYEGPSVGKVATDTAVRMAIVAPTLAAAGVGAWYLVQWLGGE